MPALYCKENFEIRPLCNVIKVNTDSTGKKATGVTYVDARGRQVEQPADLVVLATYCFNNTRLLLLSGIGTPYDPLTGRELWKVRHGGYSGATRPVFGHGLTFLATGSGQSELLAVRPDGRGDVTESHVVRRSVRGVK